MHGDSIPPRHKWNLFLVTSFQVYSALCFVKSEFINPPGPVSSRTGWAAVLCPLLSSTLRKRTLRPSIQRLQSARVTGVFRPGVLKKGFFFLPFNNISSCQTLPSPWCLISHLGPRNARHCTVLTLKACLRCLAFPRLTIALLALSHGSEERQDCRDCASQWACVHHTGPHSRHYAS